MSEAVFEKWNSLAYRLNILPCVSVELKSSSPLRLGFSKRPHTFDMLRNFHFVQCEYLDQSIAALLPPCSHFTFFASHSSH